MALPFFLGPALAIGGGFAFVRSGWNMMRGSKAASWPTMPGQIKSAEIQKRHASRSDKVRAEVRYDYKVEGVDYSADRVFFGDRVYSAWGGVAMREIAQYQPESTVQVYYNPDDPKDAVLEPGISGQVWTMFVASLVFMAIGGAIYWYQRTHGH